LFEYSNQENTKPVVVMMHGYSDTAGSLGADALTRIAGYGFFVLAVQMRGRGSSTGTRDSSGHEVYDIYDVYQNVLSKMASYSILDTSRVALIGYSGGGGNTLCFGTRFPDLCMLSVDHFGMSDYGYDGTNSWYFQDPSRQTQLNTDVGSPRTSFLNEYRVRNSREAIAKNLKGKLFIFHDTNDTSVPLLNSSNVYDQYVAEGRSVQVSKYGVYDESDLRYSVTISTDSPRWLHANPTGSAQIIQAEQYWKDFVSTLTVPEVAASGTLRILGLVRTKKFYIVLGNGTAADDGKTRCADLTYNHSTNSYTITPLLESGASDLTVSITVIGGAHAGKTASGTISTETTFNPA
jgi:dienelactone hydrolase